jgi:NADH-quinone oxidoreductase subunit M
LISEFGGLWKQLPIFSAMLMVITLSSIGLPGLNGFVGEFLILLGSFSARPLWTAAASTGVILGAIYMLWMYRRVSFGPLVNAANENISDLNFREVGLLVPILFFVVLMGIYPTPFLQRMAPAVELTLRRIQSVVASPVALNDRTVTNSTTHER